jgi:hypothetical protein
MARVPSRIAANVKTTSTAVGGGGGDNECLDSEDVRKVLRCSEIIMAALAVFRIASWRRLGRELGISGLRSSDRTRFRRVP